MVKLSLTFDCNRDATNLQMDYLMEGELTLTGLNSIIPLYSVGSVASQNGSRVDNFFLTLPYKNHFGPGLSSVPGLLHGPRNPSRSK